MYFRLLQCILLVFALSSCSPNRGAEHWDDLLSASAYGGKLRPKSSLKSRAFALEGTSDDKVKHTIAYGSDEMVANVPRKPVYEAVADGRGVELNLVQAPLELVAQTVLKDILGLNYVIDNGLKGNFTLRTTTPISKQSLMGIFETVLADQGMQVVEQGGIYRITSGARGLGGYAQTVVGKRARNRPGSGIQIVPLENVSASEIKKVLEPISREGSIVDIDENRNVIILRGTQSELHSMLETISIFDVDWMRGMSFALIPLENADPQAVAGELKNVFGGEEGPVGDTVKFFPNARLKSILITSKRAKYIARARAWVSKLDKVASSNERKLHVYEIQNRSAEELGKILGKIYSHERGTKLTVSSDVAPIAKQQELFSNPDTINEDENFAQAADKQIDGGDFSSDNTEDSIQVIADNSNNSLLIRSTAKEFERIRQILKKIDTRPTQVLLEVVIAEVTLNDELKFGIRWFFEHGKYNFSFTDALNGLVQSVFPGFSYAFATDDIQIVVNALAGITDVNIISSPTVMVLDNQSAKLQVGDQVPVVTQSASSVDAANAPIVNNVEMKDTGVILNVTPRVNDGGRVILNVNQEVSDVVPTTTSGIDSPTIRQRKINTTVVVQDGNSVALGGLIQEKNSTRKTQVPILGDVPVLGALFRNKNDKIDRTELIIFIRPSVVRDDMEAAEITDQYRQQLNLQGSNHRHAESTFERDLIRIVN